MMMITTTTTTTVCALLFVFVGALSGYPYTNGYRRLAPQRAVMFGGYYGAPAQGRTFLPQGGMTFAAGDTIATNSFVGEEQGPAAAAEDEAEFAVSAEETTEKRAAPDGDEAEPPKATRAPKRNGGKKTPRPADEDDDDEEDGGDQQDLPASWPFQGGRGRGGVPSYNAFFPIMIGGGGGGGARTRSTDGEGLYPGAATAIANSFSTGKGGVATSHATSFGDPYLSTLFRNNGNNRKLKPPQHEE